MAVMINDSYHCHYPERLAWSPNFGPNKCPDSTRLDSGHAVCDIAKCSTTMGTTQGLNRINTCLPGEPPTRPIRPNHTTYTPYSMWMGVSSDDGPGATDEKQLPVN